MESSKQSTFRQQIRDWAKLKPSPHELLEVLQTLGQSIKTCESLAVALPSFGGSRISLALDLSDDIALTCQWLEDGLDILHEEEKDMQEEDEALKK